MEDSDIHSTGGIKEQDFKIPWSYQNSTQGLGLDKVGWNLGNNLLYLISTQHIIDKSWCVHSEL